MQNSSLRALNLLIMGSSTSIRFFEPFSPFSVSPLIRDLGFGLRTGNRHVATFINLSIPSFMEFSIARSVWERSTTTWPFSVSVLATSRSSIAHPKTGCRSVWDRGLYLDFFIFHGNHPPHPIRFTVRQQRRRWVYSVSYTHLTLPTKRIV